jgi:hypothetical protein
MAKTYINGCQDVVFYQGLPMEGALYFMEPDSSSAKAIYSDKDRTVALSNPVFLDEYGRPSSVVFLGEGDYKVGHFQYTGNGDMNNDWEDQDIRPTVFSLVETEYQEGIDPALAIGDGHMFSVESIAELCAIPPTSYSRVVVNGYFERNDAPSRLFTWVEGSVAVTNLGTIFQSTLTGYNGRWIMQTEDKGIIDIRTFGVIPERDMNIFGYLNSALNWINSASCKASTLYFPSGNYKLSGGSFAFKCAVKFGDNNNTNGVRFILTQSDALLYFYNDFECAMDHGFAHSSSLANTYVKPYFYKAGLIVKASWCYSTALSAIRTMAGNSNVIIHMNVDSTLDINVTASMPVKYIMDANVTANSGVLSVAYLPVEYRSGKFKQNGGVISFSGIMIPSSYLWSAAIDEYVTYANNGGILVDSAITLYNDGTAHSTFAYPLRISKGGSITSANTSSVYHCYITNIVVDEGLSEVLGDFITIESGEIKASWYISLAAAINSHNEDFIDLEGKTHTLAAEAPYSNLTSKYVSSSWGLKNGVAVTESGGLLVLPYHRIGSTFTVLEIDAIANPVEGGLYVLANSGTITLGSLVVEAGDTVTYSYASSTWSLYTTSMVVLRDISIPLKVYGNNNSVTAENSSIDAYYSSSSFKSILLESSLVTTSILATNASLLNNSSCAVDITAASVLRMNDSSCVRNIIAPTLDMDHSVCGGDVATGVLSIHNSNVTGSVSIDGQYAPLVLYTHVWASPVEPMYADITMYEISGSISHSKVGSIDIKAYASNALAANHRTVINGLSFTDNDSLGTGITSTDNYVADYGYGFQYANERYSSSGIVGTSFIHMTIRGNKGWHKDTEGPLYIGSSDNGEVYTALMDSLFVLTGDEPFFVLYEGSTAAYWGPSASMWPTASFEFRDSRYSRATTSATVPYMGFMKIYY